MPLPFIIGGIAAVAGIAGAGSAIHGGKKMKEANDTVKSAERRHDSNTRKLKAKEEESNNAMDHLGKTELEILKSFEKFSEIFEKIKNKPSFADITLGNAELPEYNHSEIKEVSVGAAVLLGGLGGAAVGTAGGFAAAGATTAAVMALGTASTGTAIATLSGAAATNATLAALGGGAIAAGGGGMALGTMVLGGATLGVGLLVGGLIFNATGSKISDQADDAWNEMKRAERKINKIFSYLDDLQTLAEKYKNSMEKVDEKYRAHLSKLDKLVNKEGKTDWLKFTNDEKLMTQNTVLLVQLLYSMCKVKLVLENEKVDDMSVINSEEANEQMQKSKKICAAKGFAYKENLRDVVIAIKKDKYFYSYDILTEMLPIDNSDASRIQTQINDGKSVILFKEVTSGRAEKIIERFSEYSSIDAVSVNSGSRSSSVYYVDVL